MLLLNVTTHSGLENARQLDQLNSDDLQSTMLEAEITGRTSEGSSYIHELTAALTGTFRLNVIYSSL